MFELGSRNLLFQQAVVAGIWFKDHTLRVTDRESKKKKKSTRSKAQVVCVRFFSPFC